MTVCQSCQYSWEPRVQSPKECPKCHKYLPTPLESADREARTLQDVLIQVHGKGLWGTPVYAEAWRASVLANERWQRLKGLRDPIYPDYPDPDRPECPDAIGKDGSSVPCDLCRGLER